MQVLLQFTMFTAFFIFLLNFITSETSAPSLPYRLQNHDIWQGVLENPNEGLLFSVNSFVKFLGLWEKFTEFRQIFKTVLQHNDDGSILI